MRTIHTANRGDREAINGFVYSVNLTMLAAAMETELADTNEIALALSGGGFRATLFHIGSLVRLNELGYLPRIHRVVSVSGGSIAAALLALRWGELGFDESGVARNLVDKVVDPLREFCGRNVDVPTILKAVLTPWRLRRPGNLLASTYAKHLFGGATLQDLPDIPNFSFLSVELHSAATFFFNKRRVGCYTLGYSHQAATIRIADCVAASSSFPPVFSPFRLRLPEPLSGGFLHAFSGVETVFLTDGGTIDNTGSDVLWRTRGSLLISDAGKRLRPITRSWWSETWIVLTLRAILIANGAADSLRKRQIISGFLTAAHGGTYWSIATSPEAYGLPNALPCPRAVVDRLSAVRTRLNRFSAQEQKELINFGYVMADAAIRRHLIPGLPPPASLPYPDVLLA